jgi:hypothetical protein
MVESVRVEIFIGNLNSCLRVAVFKLSDELHSRAV